MVYKPTIIVWFSSITGLAPFWRRSTRALTASLIRPTSKAKNSIPPMVSGTATSRWRNLLCYRTTNFQASNKLEKKSKFKSPVGTKTCKAQTGKKNPYEGMMLTTSACVPGSEIKVHADQSDSVMEMSSPSASPALQNKTPTQDCVNGR